MNLEVSQQVFEKYSNIKKTRQVGAEFFHAYRPTGEQMKLIVAFVYSKL